MRLLIERATVWDGSGAAPFPGQVLIEGERIVAVAPAAETVSAAEGATRLDAGGKFLMPGLVEGHAHLSFVDTPRGTALGELPPEDHALLTMDAARKLLGAGFTSACSAAAAKIRLDMSICLENYDKTMQLGRFTLRDEGKSIAIGKVMKCR